MRIAVEDSCGWGLVQRVVVNVEEMGQEQSTTFSVFSLRIGRTGMRALIRTQRATCSFCFGGSFFVCHLVPTWGSLKVSRDEGQLPLSLYRQPSTESRVIAAVLVYPAPFPFLLGQHSDFPMGK